MALLADIRAVGAWELFYYQKLSGNPQNRRIKAPIIDPVELPFITDKHILLVGALSSKAKPTWLRAGYLYQQIGGIHIDDTVIYEGLGSVPSTETDFNRSLVKLNSIDLIRFTQITNDYRLRFEAMPWIEEVTLGVWVYTGTVSDSTEETLGAIRAKLETLEFKIDNL
ncbi:hypothetical protein [Nostoc sp.]|uniref:hypothetical protein n=1 Tax=Nostoc sp. TaxID=1180 RepID=UPI002FF76D3C